MRFVTTLAPDRVLLLLPGAFGAIGGIQSYNRLLIKATGELLPEAYGRCEALVLNDPPSSADTRYLRDGVTEARGYAGSRVRFASDALARAARLKPDLVVIGHVNFLSLAHPLRALCRAAAQMVLTHGVDAWRRLPWHARSALARAERVVSVSRYTAGELARRNGLDATRVGLLENAIDPVWAARFGTAEPAPLPARPVLLAVSRLDPGDRYKGIDLLIEALPEVRRTLPETRLVVIGDGADRARLEALAHGNGSAQAVLFRGWVDGEALAEAYRGCSLLALPSTGEGFGIVYIEAGFFSRASLAARAGGAVEVVEDGVNGSLIEPGDRAELARKLTALLADRPRLQALGAEARRRVRQRWEYPAFAAAFAARADEALRAAAPRRAAARPGPDAALRPRLGVVIPTYERPEYLERAHRSLAQQDEPPDAICIVCRDSDAPSLAVALRLAAEGRVPTSVATVVEPGHIPPVRQGVRELAPRTDLVAVIDDDAEAAPGWARRARDRFTERPRLGALAGYVRNVNDGRPVWFDPVSRAGYVSWRGQVVGDLYRPATFQEDRPALVFMGGNVCMRSAAWQSLEFDARLNRHIAYNYELDLALQLPALGYELRYDPRWAVTHFNAARARPAARADSREALFAMSYNVTRIALRRLRGARRLHLLLGEAALGSRRLPGLLALLPLLAVERGWAPLSRFRAAMAGRAAALSDWRRGL